VDAYSRNDWQKLRAAVDALKKPVLDESIVLEGSPVGEHRLPLDYIRSQSTPNIPNTAEEEEAMRDSHFHYQSPIPALADDQFRVLHGQPNFSTPGETRPRRASVGVVAIGNGMRDDNRHPYAQQDLMYGERSMTHQWISELPDYGRRSRSHTEPIQPPESILRNVVKSKRTTLPRFMSPPPPEDVHPPKPSQPPSPPILTSSQSENKHELVKSAARTGNLAREEPESGTERRGASRKTSTVGPSSSPQPETSESRTIASPMGSLTVGSQPGGVTAVKIYMNKVQKGKCCIYYTWMLRND